MTNKNRLSLAVVCLLVGCASPRFSPEAPQAEFAGVKHLFVFLDGTRNDDKSHTNVQELFDRVSEKRDPSIRAIYLPGVGTANFPVTGAIFGLGMERRVLMAHAFLAEQYREGDQIYIFGFSRGAHQARNLAGFISYAGLPVVKGESPRGIRKISNRMIERTKPVKDKDMSGKWESWTPGTGALLTFDAPDFKQATIAPRIAFLGLWDTVPGSSFKEFEPEPCRFPPTKKRQRYKSDPYPPIELIAHALSNDEKRDKFAPMIVCTGSANAFSWASRTRVEQKWFPGAHSDVGGGYGDPKGLPALSMNWMVELFNDLPQSPKLPLVPVSEDVYESPAHWSIGSWPGNLGSDCKDRATPNGEVIADDQSIGLRAAAGPMSVISGSKSLPRKYPTKCAGDSRKLPGE